jgi:hypothetical protein
VWFWILIKICGFRVFARRFPGFWFGVFSVVFLFKSSVFSAVRAFVVVCAVGGVQVFAGILVFAVVLEQILNFFRFCCKQGISTKETFFRRKTL